MSGAQQRREMGRNTEPQGVLPQWVPWINKTTPNRVGLVQSVESFKNKQTESFSLRGNSASRSLQTWAVTSKTQLKGGSLRSPRDTETGTDVLPDLVVPLGWAQHEGQRAGLMLLKFRDLEHKSMLPGISFYKNFILINFFTLIFFFFLAVPHSVWDLSSPTKDQTHAPFSGSTKS